MKTQWFYCVFEAWGPKSNGFTCVLIGMKNLLISSGNEVLKGEPIAKIFPDVRSQLYFELRQNGKVINPKSKVEIL